MALPGPNLPWLKKSTLLSQLLFGNVISAVLLGQHLNISARTPRASFGEILLIFSSRRQTEQRCRLTFHPRYFCRRPWKDPICRRSLSCPACWRRTAEWRCPAGTHKETQVSVGGRYGKWGAGGEMMCSASALFLPISSLLIFKSWREGAWGGCALH